MEVLIILLVELIDYFKYGSIGQRFFGIEGLGNGNNLRHALNGNSMAHQLSYTLLGDWYLEGHGCGSSYLLEVFADYGKIGIFIFSFFLGMLLISAFDIGKTKYVLWCHNVVVDYRYFIYATFRSNWQGLILY